MQKLVAIAVLLVLDTSTALADPTPVRQRELRDLVKNECVMCHGVGRLGGEGPSLLPSDIKFKDKDDLVSTILNGRGSRMPPWYTRLSREDARFIVEHVLTSEPEY